MVLAGVVGVVGVVTVVVVPIEASAVLYVPTCRHDCFFCCQWMVGVEENR